MLLELAWKARLGGFQVNVFLVLTVKDNFQAVLEGIATGQQRPARWRAVGMGETAGETHALLRETVDVWRFVRGATVGGEAFHAQIIRENQQDVRLGCRYRHHA